MRGEVLKYTNECIKEGVSNPKPIGNGWRSPGSYTRDAKF